MKKFLDFDPFTGIEQIFHYDESKDSYTIEYKAADVEPQLDAAATLKNDPDYTKSGMKSGWLHYAHIPTAVQLKWLYEYGVDVYNKDHQKKVWQLVNDPEFRRLKTTDKYHEPKR